jgi:hypothetical protein
MSGNGKRPDPGPSANNVTLSTNTSDIQSLVVRFLGRGLRSVVGEAGAFEITQDDVVDLHRQITQRVTSQNDHRIVDFYCKYIFEGGTEELLPNETAFDTFRYMGRNSCRIVEMNYSLLIRFPGREYEKQQISITLGLNNNRPASLWFLDMFSSTLSETGVMSMTIEYTDHTWSNDIKNLFQRFCDEKIKKNRLVRMYAKVVGFGSPIIEAVSGTIIGGISLHYLVSFYIDKRGPQTSEIVALPSTIENIGTKLNYIIGPSGGGVSPIILAFFMTIPLGIIVATVFFGLLRASARTLRPRSYILLCETHRQQKQKESGGLARKSIGLAAGAFGSLILGIASSWLATILKIF